MYKVKSLSPIIPSFNMEETVSFFKDLLYFNVFMDEETYAILYKDNSSVHVLRAGADIGEMEFYLEVDDVDQVWESIRDKLEGMKFKEPFDREYGMRELHIIIPQTKTLMFIGQAIR